MISPVSGSIVALPAFTSTALPLASRRCEKISPPGLLRWPCRGPVVKTDGVIMSRSGSPAPAGYRFPREVIAVAVRWYLRYGLSYRDVEELLAERGVEVDHVTIYRWVQTFTLEFIDVDVLLGTPPAIGGSSMRPT
jgi:hypothetical protein